MNLFKLANVYDKLQKIFVQTAKCIFVLKTTMQLSDWRIWQESGNLSEIIPAQGPAADQAHLTRGSSSNMTERSLGQNRRHKHHS